VPQIMKSNLCPRLKVQPKVKARAVNPIKTTTSKTQSQMAVSMNRSEGIQLFKVAVERARVVAWKRTAREGG
jgi:hypothetical protein